MHRAYCHIRALRIRDAYAHPATDNIERQEPTLPKVDFSLITYSGLPDLDPDDRLLAEALRRRGFSVAAAVWDDAGVDWSRAGTCVVRSTWDYHLRHREFASWTRRVAGATTLINPPSTIAWNIEKTYLRDLSASGCPVIPTLWASREEALSLACVFEETGWTDIVIKPVVGLSTHGVMRVRQGGNESDAAEHLAALAAGTGAMVQEYMESVESHGEQALIFIGGQFSHAVRKSAFQRLAPAGHAGEAPSAVAELAPELAVARAALALLPETPVYARVDLVRDPHGEPKLMEL